MFLFEVTRRNTTEKVKMRFDWNIGIKGFQKKKQDPEETVSERRGGSRNVMKAERKGEMEEEEVVRAGDESKSRSRPRATVPSADGGSGGGE